MSSPALLPNFFGLQFSQVGAMFESGFSGAQIVMVMLLNLQSWLVFLPPCSEQLLVKLPSSPSACR